jgi:hypothetical protein
MAVGLVMDCHVMSNFTAVRKKISTVCTVVTSEHSLSLSKAGQKVLATSGRV